ncbi:MAG: hypothetical protein ACRD0U_09535 [Acidimicrobiales bacterium]
MLSSIHPLGERAKRNRYWLTATAHVMGAVFGGAVLGAAAGAIGLLLEPLSPRWLALLAAGVCAILLVAATSSRPLPSWRRQVNEDWLTAYRGWVYGFGFGAQLGMGVVTIVTSPVVYAVVAVAVLTGSLPAAVAIGAVFGVIRGATLLAAAAVDTPDRLRSLHRRLQRLAAPVDKVAVGGLGVAAIVLGTTGVVA